MGEEETLCTIILLNLRTYQKLERSKIIATTNKTKETQGRLKTFQEEDKKSETRGQTPEKRTAN